MLIGNLPRSAHPHACNGPAIHQKRHPETNKTLVFSPSNPPLNDPSKPRPEASEASVAMKTPSALRRTVSVVQLKFATRIALLVALAGVSLAAVMHHRPAFWIMANGHQEPRDFFAALPKAAATTGIAGTFTTFEAPYAGTAALTGTGALAMNASGEITGVFSNQVGVFHGFIRATNGTIITFDVGAVGSVPNASQGTIPVSINANGDIAGDRKSVV